MKRRASITARSDAACACRMPPLPPPKARGRRRLHPVRDVLAAGFAGMRTGGPWRRLAHEFPPWPTVYHWFRCWRREGTWERRNREVRERVGVAAGRARPPSAARFRTGLLCHWGAPVLISKSPG